MPYKARNNVIKLHIDYSLMVYKARHEATKETGLHKQLLQRLPLALPGNNSQNVLNEIRKIVYYLYQSKELFLKSIQ